ncbi:hypothetical protein [Variovorax sp. KK3]|uniref:hypothetical protein n=1 Tax=Variovorax sp. KK3 TaxID=1855728 RepID=UPI00097BDACE|nr:hypothetical protein [Variovorax sp. KK3]
MTTTTPDHPPPHAQSGACAYLLHVLLQEAERRQSGFIGGVIDGVVNDHRSIPGNLPEKPLVDAIFGETLRILRHANEPFGPPALEPAPKPAAA